MTAAAISPATGRTYGVERTCAVFGVPHSSFYAWRSTQQDPAPATTVGRRGPKPALSDADLLAAIRADLARSPWHGEGHRKVLCGRPRGSNAFLPLHSASLHSLTGALSEISPECPMVSGA